MKKNIFFSLLSIDYLAMEFIAGGFAALAINTQLLLSSSFRVKMINLPHVIVLYIFKWKIIYIAMTSFGTFNKNKEKSIEQGHNWKQSQKLQQ